MNICETNDNETSLNDNENIIHHPLMKFNEDNITKLFSLFKR